MVTFDLLLTLSIDFRLVPPAMASSSVLGGPNCMAYL
jgi:hypothetical protein